MVQDRSKMVLNTSRKQLLNAVFFDENSDLLSDIDLLRWVDFT